LGLLDIFSSASPEKAIKLKAKVTQKYGEPSARQKAISQLGDMKFPEAVSSLMARFTITVEPHTTDADEKEHVFQLVTGFGELAVEPVKDFLRKSDLASSWALKILLAIVPETEVIGISTELLQKLGAEYTRNPEKKVVLMNFLEGKDDPRIAPVLVPFIEDMADDVKIAALKALGPLKYEPAREPVLKLLTNPDTARRVATSAIQTLHDSGFGVQGYREKVEAMLQEPFFVDKSGVVKKRG
jgi:HEAT repeat protein